MNTAPNVTVIPAKSQLIDGKSQYRRLNVAAYCRVSTEQEEQQNSYQVQIAYYTDLINKNKVSDKTITEQGRYSSKYALTELLICGECGTPFRRCIGNTEIKYRSRIIRNER